MMMMAQASPSVLLIDDMLSVLLQLARLLTKQNFVVSTCRNPFEGLETLKQQHFSVCFCDLSMPGMDGFELIGALREWEGAGGSEQRRRATVVALTGDTSHGALTKCIASGFDAVVTKTFPKDALVDIVRKAARGESLR